MKILFVDNCYPDFLNRIDREIVEAGITSYDKMLDHYYSYAFGTSDFYSKNMQKLGAEAKDIIINFDRLQRAWSQENSSFLNATTSALKSIPKVRNIYNLLGNPLVLLAQIKKEKPDIVYVQCIGSLPPVLTKQIKKHTKLLVGQIASKLPPDKFFHNYDLVLSSLPNMVEAIRKIGIRSEYFKIGFESSVLDRIKPGARYDVTHLGGYGKIHETRNKILEYVARKTRVDFWGYGVSNLSENSPIKKHFHGEAWGVDYYNILASSRITLTGHIEEVAGKYANNMTLYEATGCGALLMTDVKENLGDIFEVGKEVVAYSSPEDLSRKISYYLKHEEERQKIALAGQKRTLRDHTYQNRMVELKDILEKI